MYNQKLNSEIKPELVHEAIEAVNKRHYLGSSNHKTNPSGGLSGYYRNVATRIYLQYFTPQKQINPKLYPYLMFACVNHTGAGNCGELSHALYIELFLKNLSPSQREAIHVKSYPTKDEHRLNSYVLVNSTVYDIWDNKTYKQSRLKAQTLVTEKKHSADPGILSTTSVESIIFMIQSMGKKFAEQFDKEITKDRKTNHMYPTFDSQDSSDYALWVSDAFPYLFKKFKETIQDNYFKMHPDLAIVIQNKIIKDYVYLIEELRQDFALSPEFAGRHSLRVKHSHEDVALAMKRLVQNDLFADFILSLSYQNSCPEKTRDLLMNLLKDSEQLANSFESVLFTLIEQKLGEINKKIGLQTPPLLLQNNSDVETTDQPVNSSNSQNSFFQPKQSEELERPHNSLNEFAL